MPGSRAQVTVIVERALPASLPTMRSLIGAAPGGFRTAAEIDAFLHAERDSWR